MTASFIHDQPDGLRLLVHLIRFLAKGIGGPVRVGNFRRLLCKPGDIYIPNLSHVTVKVQRLPSQNLTISLPTDILKLVQSFNDKYTSFDHFECPPYPDCNS